MSLSDKSRMRDILRKNAVPWEPSPYLEPEDSIFLRRRWESDAVRVIHQTLIAPGEREADRLAREGLHPEISTVFSFPTFQRPWALWLVGERKFGFSVVSTQLYLARSNPDASFPDGAEPSAPLDSENSQISSYATKRVVAFPADLGAAVSEAWRQVLHQTRYPKESLFPCDGVTYHFTFHRHGQRPMAGKTWSPPESVPPGKLVVLSQAIHDFVWNKDFNDPFAIQAVEESLKSLRGQLDLTESR
jgi:hypothetical protein